jgi:hypothetical protein
MKKYAILLYTGLLLAGVGSSAWRLANPIKAAASSCGDKNCWNGTGGGAPTVCKDFNKGCTTCDGNWCGGNVF